MFFRKNPSSRHSKKANINKEVIEHIKDTKRKLKEKIPQSSHDNDQREL
jgi:hypothetical protein